VSPGGEHHGRITRNAGVLVVLTMASRVFGLVRDFCITHFFGASGTTDVFYMAFTIPNVLRRLVAEGTLTTVVQPAYQRVRSQEGDEAARRFYAAILGVQLIAILAITAAGVIGAPALVAAFASGFLDEPEKFELTVRLTRWLFPVIIAMSLVGISMAVLNAHEIYGVPALAPIVLNVSMIAFTVGGALLLEEDPIMGVVAGVLVGGVLQVLAQVPTLARLKLLVRPRLSFEPVVKETLLKFVPGLFGLAVYQLNIIVLRQLASYLEEGSVSYYYTADRLMELAVGVFAIAIAQGSFSTMNEQAAAGNVEGLKATWRFSMILTSLVALPAALGLGAVAVPIVSVLFLHGKFGWQDVQETAWATLAFAPGLVAISGTRATAQVFFALKDQRTPVAVSALVMVSNLLIGLALMRFGVAGLAFTLSLSSFIQTALLIVLLRRKAGALGIAKMLKPAFFQVLLSFPAVSAAYALTHLGDWERGFTPVNAAVLFGAIGAAITIYGAGAVLLRLEGVDQLAAKVTRRLRRRGAPR
jgi:putative peptidoglycan lipid II flippase